MNVKTPKELASAIEKGEDTITIEGDLANKKFELQALLTLGWAVFIGLVVILFYTNIGIGGNATSVETNASMLANILGAAAILGAIIMVVSAKNLSVLKKLKDNYNITQQSKGLVVLSKR